MLWILNKNQVLGQGKIKIINRSLFPQRQIECVQQIFILQMHLYSASISLSGIIGHEEIVKDFSSLGIVRKECGLDGSPCLCQLWSLQARAQEVGQDWLQMDAKGATNFWS